MKITEEQVKKIEKVLKKGDRVEIIPVKDGIKVLKVKRELLINKKTSKFNQDNS